MNFLLAVDLGVKTGLALFGDEGKLLWYRSHNYGNKGRLKKHIPDIFNEIPGLSAVVIEGGGPIADLWINFSKRAGINILQVFAEQWRKDLFYDRQIRNGEMAKQNAIEMARKVIVWSGLPKPTALRHDTAEAILVGLWGALQSGLLPSLPKELI